MVGQEGGAAGVQMVYGYVAERRARMTGRLFIAPDPHDQPCLWRETSGDPECLHGERELDPQVWAIIRAAVEPTEADIERVAEAIEALRGTTVDGRILRMPPKYMASILARAVLAALATGRQP